MWQIEEYCCKIKVFNSDLLFSLSSGPSILPALYPTRHIHTQKHTIKALLRATSVCFFLSLSLSLSLSVLFVFVYICCQVMTRPKFRPCPSCQTPNQANRKTCNVCFASLSTKKKIQEKVVSLDSQWGESVLKSRNAGRIIDSARIAVSKSVNIS